MRKSDTDERNHLLFELIYELVSRVRGITFYKFSSFFNAKYKRVLKYINQSDKYILIRYDMIYSEKLFGIKS